LSASLRIGPNIIRSTDNSVVRASAAQIARPKSHLQHPRKAARDAIERGLIHWDWFAGRLDQPVGAEQDAVVLRLGLEQKADRHKSRAAQQPDQHYPTVRLFIRVMKRMGHVATQYRNWSGNNRMLVLT
jgi:hypothetical protein